MPNQDEILKRTKEALDKAVNEARKNRDFAFSIRESIIEILNPILQEIANNVHLTKDEIKDVVSQIKIEIPKIDVPHATVDVKIPEIKVPKSEVTVRVPDVKIPEIKIPVIKVPKPEVTVNVPEIKIPKIVIPETKVEIPEHLSVNLKNVDRKHPLPVILTDLAGNPYTSAAGGAGGTKIVSAKRRSADLNISPINIAAAGDNTVITGVAGQSIKIYKIFFICNTAVNIILKNGASINMTGTMNFTANGSMTLDYDDEPWFRLANGNDFIINLSSAQQVSGSIHYIQNNE